MPCRRRAGRIGVALPGLRRQHRGRLRRAPRARPRPAPRPACAGCRRPARDRRPAQRDHHFRLHAPRGSEPGAGTRSRHRGPERARPRLHARRSASSHRPTSFARSLAAMPALDPGRRQAETRQGRADYLANLVHTPAPGDLDMGEVMATLRERLPADAILTNGAGNFTVWAHRFYEFRHYRTQLAPTSGAMGYGVPAAVAAKILDPRADGRLHCRRRRLPDDRAGARDSRAGRRRRSSSSSSTTACTGRSGCTRSATTRGASPGPISSIPTSRRWPERSARTARSSSGPSDFAAAFEEALACGRPAVIELRVDPEALTPRQSLSEIREAARARASAS